MARKLGLGLHWDAGDTSADLRRELVRCAVVKHGPGLMLARKRGGSVLTAGMAFVQCYGRAP